MRLRVHRLFAIEALRPNTPATKTPSFVVASVSFGFVAWRHCFTIGKLERRITSRMQRTGLRLASSNVVEAYIPSIVYHASFLPGR
jgi:hypothetical protein